MKKFVVKGNGFDWVEGKSFQTRKDDWRERNRNKLIFEQVERVLHEVDQYYKFAGNDSWGYELTSETTYNWWANVSYQWWKPNRMGGGRDIRISSSVKGVGDLASRSIRITEKVEKDSAGRGKFDSAKNKDIEIRIIDIDYEIDELEQEIESVKTELDTTESNMEVEEETLLEEKGDLPIQELNFLLRDYQERIDDHYKEWDRLDKKIEKLKKEREDLLKNL